MQPGAPSPARDVPEYLQGVYEIVVSPPEWLVPTLLAGVAIVGLTAAWRAHSRDVTPEAVKGMAANGWAVATFGGVTWIITEMGTFGFLVDVVVGVAIGGALYLTSVDHIVEMVEEGIADIRNAN